MKKRSADKKSNLITTVIGILFLPLIAACLVIFGIIYLVSSPFERRKYKKSAYFKKFGYKYYFGITNSHSFEICGALEKGGLGGELISAGAEGPEFLISGKALYIISDVFCFAADRIYDEIHVVEEDDKKRLFDEAFAEEIAKEIYAPYRDYEIKYLVAENTLLFYTENEDADKEDRVKGLMKSHDKIAFCRDLSIESLKEIL